MLLPVCVGLCVPVCLYMHLSPCPCRKEYMYVCMHVCALRLLNLHVCCVHNWRMKVCGPGLTVKRENVCSQLLKCKCFGRVNALSTQPWRLAPGPSDRLSQPAVSMPSQNGLRICFQRGRCSPQGRNWGHKRSWQIYFLRRYCLVCFGEGGRWRWEGETRANTDLCVQLGSHMCLENPTQKNVRFPHSDVVLEPPSFGTSCLRARPRPAAAAEG